jgi:1-acyl-sn-glycerol-3-phosphate acyltransferase
VDETAPAVDNTADLPGTPMLSPPKWLATLTGNLFLVLGSLLLGFVAMVASVLPPRGNWTYAVARLWSASLLRASAVRVEARFAAPLEPKTSYVFLANHQSLYDIPVVLTTIPGQVRMMAKRSLFRIPFFGWGLAAGGFIPVDRGDRSTARQSFAAAARRLRGGASVLLFPEGTRSKVDHLLPFERGGFLLALKLGLPIVPVGIRGTRAVQQKGSWTIRPGAAVVRYGEPIEVSEYGLRRRGELVEVVRRRVAELAGLDPEAGCDPEAAGAPDRPG